MKKQIALEMNKQKDSLRGLLKAWLVVEHNQLCRGEFTRWSKIARDLGIDKVAELVKKAADARDRSAQHLSEAVREIEKKN